MPFLKLAFIAGLVAAVFGVLGWALGWLLGWLAVTFGYQSNDANVPIVLLLSALIFAAVGWLLWGKSGKRARRRLRHWWRG